MIDKTEAREKIKGLVEKYQRILDSDNVKAYNEEMTKKDFILPLFEALGWDTANKYIADEVTAEEKVSKGRVDYAFRIRNIPKLFVEAKSLKADLDKAEYAQQAINYAWHKGCTWAVLTDFESLKVFNAELQAQLPSQSKLYDFSYSDYLSRFDDLWFLSKESLEQGLLDKLAERFGKKIKKSKVDEQILDDLMRWRQLLTTNIMKNTKNMSLSEQDLDEAVQRIIDRLIFIRVCEDRELEPPTLLPKAREWHDKKRGTLNKIINESFRKFDDAYNSKLFQPHLCEELIIDDEVLLEVIEELYRTKDWSIRYDFSAIDADVLGNIYEQYLGHILKKTAKRAKIESKHAYRKEQGIYYTPIYIVDYIVKNTLGTLLDEDFNLDEIKVLDPACGSGSFLLKAFDVLNSAYNKKEGVTEQTKLKSDEVNGIFNRKVRIVTNNLFGVDLDPKAVEITQLNLLLKTAEKRHRLPTLQNNIKNGNSLIDDENIAGDKAFKWEEEFNEIMKNGGFDVVIGNPPYEVLAPKERSEIDTKKEISYYRASYQTLKGKLNLYQLMIEKAYNLMKDGGRFGFIVPNTIMAGQNTSELRRFLLENAKNIRIFEFPEKAKVFKDVTQGVCILIWTKGKGIKQTISVCSGLMGPSNLVEAKPFEMELEDIRRLDEDVMPIPFVKNNAEIQLLRKILTFPKIKDIESVEIFQGEVNLTMFKDCLKQSGGTKLVRGDQIKCYTLVMGGESKPSFLDAERFLKKAGLSEKAKHHQQKRLAFQEVANIALKRRLNGVIIDEGFFLGHTCDYIVSKNEDILKVLLGLFNSSLLNWRFKLTSATNHVSGDEVRQLPVPEIDLSKDKAEYKEMIVLVDRMLALNKYLNDMGDKKTDERQRVEEEIKKTDTEIDELVYKLYEITDEEKKIIEMV